MMSDRLIPQGMYCYSQLGEMTEEGYIPINLCPYWKRTTHGTIRCEYLKLESVDNNKNALGLALEYFGSEEEMDKHAPLILLWDQVKECDVNPSNN